MGFKPKGDGRQRGNAKPTKGPSVGGTPHDLCQDPPRVGVQGQAGEALGTDHVTGSRVPRGTDALSRTFRNSELYHWLEQGSSNPVPPSLARPGVPIRSEGGGPLATSPNSSPFSHDDHGRIPARMGRDSGERGDQRTLPVRPAIPIAVKEFRAVLSDAFPGPTAEHDSSSFGGQLKCPAYYSQRSVALGRADGGSPRSAVVLQAPQRDSTPRVHTVSPEQASRGIVESYSSAF